MADKKNNDEYQLDDVDLLGGASDEIREPDVTASQLPPSSSVASPFGNATQVLSGLPVVQRNAIIVIGVVIWLVVIYKLIAYFHHKPTKVEAAIPKVVMTAPPVVPVSAPPQPQPTQPVMTQGAEQSVQAMNEKIMSLSSINDGLRGDISNLNNQMSTMQSTAQSTTNKLQALTDTIQRLNEKLDSQAQAMQLLELKLTKVATKPKPSVKHGIRAMYYVQALIPGRAWLISADGENTVTVREGSPLAGYGSVQMIDPNRGRVLTSSGRTIRFSHQDS